MSARASFLPILLTLVASLPSCCRSGSPASALPTSRPPALVTVTPSRPPCKLPQLPQPIAIDESPFDGGHWVHLKDGLTIAERDLADAGGFFVPRENWNGLAVYLAQEHAWIELAAGCLEIKEASP